MPRAIDIGGRRIGPGHPAFIIAEAGVNHNGSLALARKLVDAAMELTGRSILLEVDGGVKADNIESIAAAGADTFVAGSAIFGGGDYRAKIAAMRAALARTTGSA